MGVTQYVVLPERPKPLGGVNVMLRISQVLVGEGHDICLLHANPSYRYTYFPHDLPVAHDPRMKRVLRSHLDSRLKRIHRMLVLNPFGPGTPKRIPEPDDVLILPEFAYPEIAALYPGIRYVVAVQDVYGFFRGYGRDEKGAALAKAEMVFATSEACRDAIAAVSDRPVARINLPVGHAGQGFQPQKRKLIAYMPRKRRPAAQAVVTALSEMPEAAGYAFEKIDGMQPDQVAKIYDEALIFLSFSKEDGFGLPPAEAMLSGCLTIGYTGVGGEEYFTPETGFPVPDSDIVAMIRTTRQVLSDYATDPAPLDALRQSASQNIAQAYSEAAFAASVKEAWGGLAP